MSRKKKKMRNENGTANAPLGFVRAAYTTWWEDRLAEKSVEVGRSAQLARVGKNMEEVRRVVLARRGGEGWSGISGRCK